MTEKYFKRQYFDRMRTFVLEEYSPTMIPEYNDPDILMKSRCLLDILQTICFLQLDESRSDPI